MDFEHGKFYLCKKVAKIGTNSFISFAFGGSINGEFQKNYIYRCIATNVLCDNYGNPIFHPDKNGYEFEEFIFDISDIKQIIDTLNSHCCHPYIEPYAKKDDFILYKCNVLLAYKRYSAYGESISPDKINGIRKAYIQAKKKLIETKLFR